MQRLSNLLWGLVLVVLGVVFGLNILGVTDIDVFFPGWWTLIIIVPCFINLFIDKNKVPNLIGVLFGVCLLLACQGILDFELVWKMVVPVGLVIAGLAIIFHGASGSKASEIEGEHERKSASDQKEYWATFSGQNLTFEGEKFSGCKLDAVFGGIKCDLYGAKIEDGAVITASSTFGGVTIYVPRDVVVELRSTSMFGGVSDKREVSKTTTEKKKVIYVDAACVFGGVEIK